MRRYALPLLLALPLIACDDGSDPSPAQQAEMGADATFDAGRDAEPMDAAPADARPDQALDQGEADQALVDQAVADRGPVDGDVDQALPDLDVDMAAPDQGTPAACAAWDGLADRPLLEALHAELRAAYTPIPVENDLGGNPNRYTTARYRMFTEVEYREVDGQQGHECAYTGRVFPGEPGVEPDDDIINCEHTWPRSRMGDRSTRLYQHQQSDIHHLLPTVNMCNSLRGSLRFGEPVDGLNLDCSPAKMGRSAGGNNVFEPRDERKGDVARVVLYFSARWGGDIVDWEEATLKRWHAQDPVSDYERARNDAIEAIQGNRNPFIDCPELVDRIDDFQSFPIGDREADLPGPPN